MTDRRTVNATQLATLSHEFRTPLNGVLGMARLLDGTQLSAEQRAYVSALRDSGEHLLSLVNELLDFARLGEERVEMHAASFDLEGLLRQVAELMSPRAHEKGLEIAWAVEAGLGSVIGDEGRLRQVLLNYVGNAIKFTAQGGVLLRATRTETGVRLSVADTGPGVAPEARRCIFDAFEQANPAEDWKQGGVGLGLAIVARLAQAMDGAAGVDEAVWEGAGGGAEFWFEAPLAAEHAPRPLAGPAVIVASPSVVVRTAAVLQVEADGGRAHAGADLAAVLAAAPRDAVVLFDQALAASDKPLKPPAGRRALILLKPDERGVIERRRASGFAGYLIKPLRRASLAEQVRAAQAAAPRVAAPATEDDRIAEAAAPGLRVLLAEDNPINALLARALLEREGARVDRAGSGEEALAALSAQAYDLVLMDLRMPGLNGVDATRALRARGVTTPVVALTADAFDDDRRLCLAAGMDDFLVKPLTPPALRAALVRWTSVAREAKVLP